MEAAATISSQLAKTVAQKISGFTNHKGPSISWAYAFYKEKLIAYLAEFKLP